MDGRECSFLPAGENPRICYSALPSTPDQILTLQYTPLDRSKSEIRVLCPNNRAGTSIDKHEFTLRTVSLEDKPKYWALSYVWGDSTERSPICISGQTFMATRNLCDALKRIRNLMTNETKDLQLWIDAICINQANTTEKSWQVAIMSRIYSQSYCIHVWLGPADQNATVAMEFAAKIGSQDYNAQNPLTDEIFAKICEDAIGRSVKKEGGNDLELLWALEDIFHHRQYWKRAWTFQEFCLSSSIMWCGDSWLSLGSIMNFIDRTRDMAMRARTGGSASSGANPVVAKFVQCIGDIGEVLIDKLKAGAFRKKYGLLEEYNDAEQLALLLSQTMPRQAANPKDKIYCLLGLCGVDITPDYSDAISVGKLYRETSTIVMRGARRTSLFTVLLSSAGLANQGHQRALPSWTVEWDVVAKAPVVFKVLDMESNKHFITSAPSLQISNLEISFQAIIVDAVDEVHTPTYNGFRDPEGVQFLKFFFNNPAMEILPFVFQSQPMYRTGISLLAAVFSILLLGRDVLSNKDYDRLFVNRTPGPNFYKIARIFLRLMFDMWKCTGTILISLKTYISLAQADQQRTQTVEEYAAIDQTISKIFGLEKEMEFLTGDELCRAFGALIPPVDGINFFNKTPFGAHASLMAALKSKEGYIGVGRAGVEKGDMICVLRDANVPFILRSVEGEDGEGERFKLVGPCYVEGLMDGEAWEMVCAGEREVRRVVVV